MHLADFMDGRKNDHCGESDRGAAYEYVYIRYQYPHEPDDGIYGFVMLIMSRASGERISEVLTERPDLFNIPHAITEVADGSVDFEQVSFAYPSNPNKEVITNLSVHINAGETIGILGGTGSAKSSFASLIPRLYDVTKGEVRVGGVPVKDYDMASLRDSVAMVLQKNVLFSGTIKENLRWGKENATDVEMMNACRLAQADEFIRDFPAGYDTYIERGGAATGQSNISV